MKKNLFFFTFSQFVNTFIPIFTIPFIIRTLGLANYGIYTYTLTIIGYFLVFTNLGNNVYCVRRVAQCKNDDEKSEAFWEIFAINIRNLLIIIVILFFIIYYLQYNYSLFILYQSILLLSSFFNISWFFIGTGKIRISAITDTLSKIFYLLLLFIFIKDSSDFINYIVINSVITFITPIYLWFKLPKYIYKNRKFYISNSKYKEFIYFQLPQISIIIYTSYDKILLGNSGLIKDIAIYDPIQKIIKTFLILFTSYSPVLLPKISSLVSEKKSLEIVNFFNNVIELIYYIGIPSFLGINLIKNDLIYYIFGSNNSLASIILVILSINILIIPFNNLFLINGLVAHNLNKDYFRVVFSTTIFNIVLNSIFINKYGVIACAIISVLTELFVLFYSYKIYSKFIKITLFRKEFLIPIFSSMIMYLIILFIARLLPFTYIYLIFKIFFAILIYIILLVLFRDKKINRIVSRIINTK